jgi:hypothetical protein
MAVQCHQQTTMGGWLVRQLLDPSHALLVLAQQIAWEGSTEALRPYYHRLGRYANPSRLMVGLHLLKHRWNLSDARVVASVYMCWLRPMRPCWTSYILPLPGKDEPYRQLVIDLAGSPQKRRVKCVFITIYGWERRQYP